jgi:acyl dehydratase
MPTVFGSPGPWWRDPRTGVDYAKNLHVEQDLEIFAEIPVSGTAIGRNRVTALHDRGPERGALAEIERDIIDAASGTLLARSRRIELLRGAGGFSAASGVSDEAPKTLPRIGDAGPPDVEFDLPLSPRTGLMYRLSGDLNPLHVDPATARQAGFPRPILHGLGTFAVACHAALSGLADYRSERIRRLGVRFSSPVYPGDILHFQFWREGGNTARLRALAPERQVTVLDNGVVELAD